jgi:hypothetical protein
MNDRPERNDRPAAFAEGSLRETLEWVLGAINQPALAAGDWIAYEVDPARGTAAALLTDPTVPVSRIRRARILWSALRAEGESAAERALGSRLAVAAAAAAFLFHGERITNHDDGALLASLRSASADDSLHPEIRTMVRMAERKLAG